jgi:hypothetical protein
LKKSVQPAEIARIELPISSVSLNEVKKQLADIASISAESAWDFCRHIIYALVFDNSQFRSGRQAVDTYRRDISDLKNSERCTPSKYRHHFIKSIRFIESDDV